jgi:hypothetical protein
VGSVVRKMEEFRAVVHLQSIEWSALDAERGIIADDAEGRVYGHRRDGRVSVPNADQTAELKKRLTQCQAGSA